MFSLFQSSLQQHVNSVRLTRCFRQRTTRYRRLYVLLHATRQVQYDHHIRKTIVKRHISRIRYSTHQTRSDWHLFESFTLHLLHSPIANTRRRCEKRAPRFESRLCTHLSLTYNMHVIFFLSILFGHSNSLDHSLQSPPVYTSPAVCIKSFSRRDNRHRPPV